MKTINSATNFGFVPRMDNLQTSVRSCRLQNADKIIFKKKKNAKLYEQLLCKNFIFIAVKKINKFNTCCTFFSQVQKRDSLRKYLLKKIFKY
jgi:dTDP-4-amino-4,6-dideoxygalactose transaminase